MANWRAVAGLGSILAAFLLGTYAIAGGEVHLGAVAQGGSATWTYYVGQEADGSLVIDVKPRDTSTAGLHALVDENRSLATRLLNAGITEADAMVTFARPLPLTEFDSWAQSSAVRTGALTARTAEKDGRRGTIGTSATPANLDLPPSFSRRLVEWIATNAVAQSGVEFRGIISAESWLSLRDYERVAGDPRVFLVDLSGEAARSEFKQSTVLRTRPDLQSRPTTVRMRPVYAWLERSGLAP
jgi:hypothetical protein